MSATDRPDLVGAIQALVDARAARIETTLPAVIVSYDDSTQRAIVRPTVRSALVDASGNRVTRDIPPIAGVPVAFPSASGFSITWPLSAGDPCTLVFASRDIAGWLQTGKVPSDPVDPRRHDITDAICIPGGRSFKDPIPGAGVASSALVIRGDDIRLGSSSAADLVALSTANDANWQALATLLTSWIVVATDGGAALQVAATALQLTGWPASTAAVKVKAE